MTTHALENRPSPARSGRGLTILRYLDLGLLAAALPLFALAGLPLLGYAVAALAWCAQRAIHELAARRAKGADPRAMVGVLAGSMIARGWLVAGSIFAVGLIATRADGLAAAVLSIALFTVYFAAQMVVRPFDEARRRA